MKRSELEHLIRAAGRIAGEREFVVIGSQAILGQFPDAPPALLASMECGLYPRKRPELARLASTKLDPAITRAVRGRIERDHPKGNRGQTTISGK